MSRSPNNTDHHSTRDAILDAAQGLFADRGFADTSVSRIAEAAGVTKSLIHHHFGSKDQLWREVKNRRFREYFDIQRQELVETAPDIECVRDGIIRLFNVFRGDPELARLIAWHIVEPGHDSHEEEYELITKGIEKLLEGQEIGHMRRDIDPRYAVVAFLSLIIQWFIGRREYLAWLDLSADRTDVDEEYLDTILKIFFEGIIPRGPDRPTMEGS
jgi:TetR/AcrR family transcriptional regulator